MNNKYYNETSIEFIKVITVSDKEMADGCKIIAERMKVQV